MAMKPLIESLSFLRDPKRREQILRRSVLDSSYFEGVRGLKLSSRKARKSARLIAPSKKIAKGS